MRFACTQAGCEHLFVTSHGSAYSQSSALSNAETSSSRGPSRRSFRRSRSRTLSRSYCWRSTGSPGGSRLPRRAGTRAKGCVQGGAGKNPTRRRGRTPGRCVRLDGLALPCRRVAHPGTLLTEVRLAPIPQTTCRKRMQFQILRAGVSGRCSAKGQRQTPRGLRSRGRSFWWHVAGTYAQRRVICREPATRRVPKCAGSRSVSPSREPTRPSPGGLSAVCPPGRRLKVVSYPK
jgi:hypothetical protein